MAKNYFNLSRRTFLAGSASLLALPAFAQSSQAPAQRLKLVTRSIDVRGKSIKAYGIEGAAGANFLRGANFHVELANGLKAPALLHWHGLIAPSGSDGAAPPESPLKPRESQIYDFALPRGGTHFMRASAGLMQQELLAAPLIVHDLDDLAVGEQEAVMFLQDVNFRDPDDILSELMTGKPKSSVLGSLGLGKDAASAFTADGLVRQDAWLANERGLDDPDIVTVDAGLPVRLRLINACAASNMLVDFAGLEAVLIALDGRPISALNVRELPLATGQRADVRVRLPGPGAFPVLARAEGQPGGAGIILKTAGAEVVAVDAGGAAPLVTEFALEGRPFGADAPAERPVDVKATFDLGLAAGRGYNINGNSTAEGIVLQVKQGQRVEILLRNQTRQPQAMHMHGHAFQVRGALGARFAGPMRDTLLIPAEGRVVISFDADNPGLWPFASTNIYRRAAGLQGLIGYSV